MFYNTLSRIITGISRKNNKLHPNYAGENLNPKGRGGVKAEGINLQVAFNFMVTKTSHASSKTKFKLKILAR